MEGALDLSGATPAAPRPPAFHVTQAARRLQDSPSPPDAGRDGSGPAADVSSALSSAEDAADKSRTARRDALASQLQRLIEVARKLNGMGEQRSNAVALRALAGEIAKVARALADAERALPPEARRGVPVPPVPQAQTTAAAPDEPTAGDAASDGKAAAAEAGRQADADATPAAVTTAGDAADVDQSIGGLAFLDNDDPVAHSASEPPAERRQGARSGRDGTRQLLLIAADMLDAMRRTVRKAELFAFSLDPEESKGHGKAGREIEGFAIELRGLAGRLAEPAGGLDLTV
jgi:hypothetical protein